MATASGSSDLAVASWSEPEGHPSKSDRYLARRLAAASADYKGVAVTTFLLAACVAAMGWILFGIGLEHWIIAGGLPRWARWTWFVAGLVVLAAAIVRWIVPLLRYRVNLVYAARVIEADHPELHNDLVNAVLVKARPDGAAAKVVRSLERRAAKRLARVPNDGVVDRTAAFRLALALAALVVGAGVYELTAPKSLLVSGARLIAPWAGLAAPTRVTIGAPRLSWRQPGAAPQPGGDPEGRVLELGDGGSVTLVRGRQLIVSSEIRGLRTDEKPTLVVGPIREDGTIDQASVWRMPMVPMVPRDHGPSGGAGGDPVQATAGRSARGVRHLVVVPDAVRGLEEDVEFYISAGDASSDRVRIAIVDTPSLLVREVRYEYPAYTRREPETVAWQGDLRAVEGTRATIVAEGNRPLESAWIDLDCDGKRDVELRVGQHDLTRATGAFRLQLKKDRSGPEHGSYRFVFQPIVPQATRAATAREEPVVEKLEHRIEVVPDMPPEVSIEEPREPVLTVPPGGPVEIRVRATDPDFALAGVAVETRLRGGGAVQPIKLLSKVHTGVFRGAARVVPETLGAVPGSVLEYRAVAIDTRQDPPNKTASPWQALRIDASAPPPRQPPPRDDPKQPAQGGNEAAGSNPAGQKPEKPGKDEERQSGGEPREDQNREGQQGQDQQGQQQQNTTQQGKDQQGKDPGGAGQRSKPEEAQRGGQGDGGDNEGGTETKTAENKPAEKGGGENKTGQNNTTETKGGSAGQAGGGKESGGKQSGGQQAAENAAGGKAGGEQSADGRGADRGQSGEKRGGGDRAGKPRDTVAADGTNDGEAMERILDHRRRQEEASRQAQQAREGGKSAGGEGGGKKPEAAPGVKSAGPNDKPGQAEQQNDQAKAGEKSDAPPPADPQQQPPAACANAEGKPCGKQGCSSCGGGSKPNGGGSGASGAAGASDGQGQQDQKDQPGQGPQGQGAQGQGAQGQGAQSQGAQGQGAQGQSQQGQGQQGQGRDGQGKQGQGPSGQGQQGQGQQGQGDQGQADAGQGSGQKQEGQPGQAEGRGGEGRSQAGTSGEGRQAASGRDQASDGRQGEGKQQAGGLGKGKQGQGDAAQQKEGDGQQPGPGNEQAGGEPAGKQPIGPPQAGKDQNGKDQAGKDQAGKDQAGKVGNEQAGDRAADPGEGKSPASGDRAAGQSGGKSAAPAQPQPDGTQPATGSQVGAGGRTGGRGGSGADAAAGPPPDRELEWTAEDLAHARNAADLAVEHLRDSVESGRRDVLDALGWTPEQARAFLDRWQAMRRSAGSSDPRQRGEFEQTLRSLGLRPGGARNTRDVPTDIQGGQSEGRRSRPPASYREQLKAYLRGTSGE